MMFPNITRVFVAIFVLFLPLFARPDCGPPKPRFKAVAFDYFVIFDPSSIVPQVEREFPGKGVEFTRLWQSKQFEYTFLRTITKRYEDFFHITGDALDYIAASMKLPLSDTARLRLLNAYLKLKPWPDVIAALIKLRAAGVKIITISNFSPEMLRANADSAKITDLFDLLLSTDENHSFKPAPEAYAMGPDKLKLRTDEIAFAAFGGWDVAGAKSFGYRTYWVNRFGVTAERLGVAPDGASKDLDGLLEFVLGNKAQGSSTGILCDSRINCNRRTCPGEVCLGDVER